MIKKEEYNRLKIILKDFKIYEPKKVNLSKFKNVSVLNYDPPSYIVQILLFSVLELENYGRMDKVLWHTFIKYKNYIFMIRDYKFGTWSIECLRESNETIKFAEEIKSKIKKASLLLDKELYKILKLNLENDNFYINNVYNKLISTFNFFENKILESEREFEKLEIENRNINNYFNFIVNVYNKKFNIENKLSKYTFALILSFFSILEFILDVFFIFENHKKKFLEFKKEKWIKRFKIVFNLKNNIKIKKLYDELINIKNNYRNPLSHGLYNEVNILVFLPTIGLVPLSYEYLLNKVQYNYIEIKKEDALYILRIFKEFFKIIENEEPYNFYNLFLNYGFPIPVNKNELSKIKNKMTTYEEFKEYLDKRSRYEDMIINREI